MLAILCMRLLLVQVVELLLSVSDRGTFVALLEDFKQAEAEQAAGAKRLRVWVGVCWGLSGCRQYLCHWRSATATVYLISYKMRTAGE